MHHLFLFIHHSVQREFLKPSELLFLKTHVEIFCLSERGAWYTVRIIWRKVKSRRELWFFHNWELKCLLKFYFSYINWDKRWVEVPVVQGLCNRNLYQSLNDTFNSCVIFSSCFALDLSHPGCSMQAASSAILQVTREGPIFSVVLLKSFESQSCEVRSTANVQHGWSLQMSFCYDCHQKSSCGYLRAVISALSSVKITCKHLSFCDTRHSGFVRYMLPQLPLKISLGKRTRVLAFQYTAALVWKYF